MLPTETNTRESMMAMLYGETTELVQKIETLEANLNKTAKIAARGSTLFFMVTASLVAGIFIGMVVAVSIASKTFC